MWEEVDIDDSRNLACKVGWTICVSMVVLFWLGFVWIMSELSPLTVRSLLDLVTGRRWFAEQFFVSIGLLMGQADYT